MTEEIINICEHGVVVSDGRCNQCADVKETLHEAAKGVAGELDKAVQASCMDLDRWYERLQNALDRTEYSETN